MSKNIFKIILVFILLFCLSSSISFVHAYTIGKKKTENTVSELTYADMEAQFANNVFITKDEEFKIFVEKDLELENLIADCKKHGLMFGLALGGGSARGLAHVGVILALEAYDIPIDIIAGTSIGSVIGSLYASGATVKELEEVALSIKKSKTLFMIDPTFPRSGLISGDRIEKMLNKFALKDKTFDDLNIPFAAVATEIENGAEVIISHGKLIDAVRASISIPGIFTPVKYQDYYLVDGGLVNPVPANVAQMMGADIIIAVNLSKMNPYISTIEFNKENVPSETSEKQSDDDKKEKTSIFKKQIAKVKLSLEGPNLFEVINQSIDIMQANITEQSLEGTDIIIVPFGIKDINTLDFDEAELLIKGGIMATLINIPRIKEVMEEKLKGKE